MRYDTTVTKETPAAIAEPINSINEGLFNEFGEILLMRVCLMNLVFL